MLSTRDASMLIVYFGVVYCYLEMIPEKLEVTYAHPNHVINYTLKVRRYGRNSSYYIAGSGVLKQTWNNNVTVHVDTYEYLHNEYRLSFMTIHNKLCNVINADIFMGSILRGLGFSCPIYPGLFVIKNATYVWEDFPYKFPLNKFMGNMTARRSSNGELLLWMKLYARIKQINTKKP